MNEDNPLEPSRLIWIGLIALLAFGLGIALLKPPEGPPDELATPGPSPAMESLQCLDGKTFRSIDEIVGQVREDGGFPTKERWTLTFARGGYVLDQGGSREAGSYRCDGSLVYGKSALGSHRAQLDPAATRLAWDGLGFELDQAPVTDPRPTTATTSG